MRNNRIIATIKGFANLFCAPLSSTSTICVATAMIVLMIIPELSILKRTPFAEKLSIECHTLLQHVTITYLICLVAHLLSLKLKWIKNWVLGIAFSLTLLLSFIDNFLIIYYNVGISVWNVTNAIGATWSETRGFLLPIIYDYRFWHMIASYMLTIAVTLRLVKELISRLKRHAHLIKMATTASIIAAIATFASQAKDAYSNFEYELDLIPGNHTPYSNTTTYRIVQTLNSFNKFSKIIDVCYETNQNIAIESCTFKSPNIILIIGESFNKHHSSIYGYQRNTNPILSKKEGLVAFNDVIAPANLTYLCMQRFLSTANADDRKLWYESPMFPAIFKKAGYNVVYYSNQFINRLNNNSWIGNFAGSFFFNDSKTESLMFDYRNSEKKKYDMQLIDLWKQNRNAEERNSHNLIMLHLNGQHSHTIDRFPKEFTYFTADSVTEADWYTLRERTAVANFDNATRYNDMVVNEIINMYSDKDAIIIYFSDHGEETADFRHLTGRTFDFDAGGGSCAHNQLDVPFLVYTTETYRKNHPEMVAKLEAAVNRPFMTDDLPHLLLELAGIATPSFIPERSVINDKFNAHRQRLIKMEGKIYNYDTGKFVN